MKSDLQWDSVVCACHKLQNAIKTALSRTGPLLEDIFAKCRKVVGHFKHSNLATEALLKEQRDFGIARPKKLIQDVATRWNSSYNMLQRLVDLRSPVTAVLSKEKGSKLLLAPKDRAVAESLLSILSDLEVVTAMLSGEQYPLSQVLPIIHGVVNDTLLDNDDDLLLVVRVKDMLKEQLNNRFRMASLEADNLSVIAAALDPRFRNLPFLTAAQRHEVETILVEKARLVRECSPSEEDKVRKSVPDKRQMTNSEKVMARLLNESESDDESSVEEEVCSYLHEKKVKRSEDPLLWWQVHRERFPRLAVLAQRVLAVPASSTASERVFSTSGLIVDQRRSSMTPEMIDALVFLNQNHSLLAEPTTAAMRVLQPKAFIFEKFDNETDASEESEF